MNNANISNWLRSIFNSKLEYYNILSKRPDEMLDDEMPVEWENLNPDEIPDFFSEIVDDLMAEMRANASDLIKYLIEAEFGKLLDNMVGTLQAESIDVASLVDVGNLHLDISAQYSRWNDDEFSFEVKTYHKANGTRDGEQFSEPVSSIELACKELVSRYRNKLELEKERTYAEMKQQAFQPPVSIKLLTAE